nr:unnamed protein product [Callosobruchus analis]
MHYRETNKMHSNLSSAPTPFLSRNLFGRFEEPGSVAKRPGRGVLRNIRTEDNVETVRQSVVEDSYSDDNVNN